MKLFKRINNLIEKKLGIRFHKIGSIKNRTNSIHNLNYDRGLTIPQRVIYLLLNWFNNQFSNFNIDKKLEIRDFKCNNLKTYWRYLYIKSSPPRNFCDLFWKLLPWDKIKDELGEINILDIGCRHGDYGILFVNYSNDLISEYNGIDIKRSDKWKKIKEKYPYFKFNTYDGKDIINNIPSGTNLILSQSSIEHIDEDLSFFRQIRDYINLKKKKTVIQIHLFPSKVCLYLYRYHGARQYTPRKISKITQLYRNFSYSILFNLGGKFCNFLHYKFITIPIIKKNIDFRDSKTQLYDKLLYNMMKKDMKSSYKYPSFYALIIHSNCKKKIF